MRSDASSTTYDAAIDKICLETRVQTRKIVADTLSRAFDRSVKKSNTEEEIKAHVDMIRHNAQVSDPM